MRNRIEVPTFLYIRSKEDKVHFKKMVSIYFKESSKKKKSLNGSKNKQQNLM